MAAATGKIREMPYVGYSIQQGIDVVVEEPEEQVTSGVQTSLKEVLDSIKQVRDNIATISIETQSPLEYRREGETVLYDEEEMYAQGYTNHHAVEEGDKEVVEMTHEVVDAIIAEKRCNDLALGGSSSDYSSLSFSARPVSIELKSYFLDIWRHMSWNVMMNRVKYMLSLT